MAIDSSWISTLPKDLQIQIYSTLSKYPETTDLLTKLYVHLTENNHNQNHNIHNNHHHSHSSTNTNESTNNHDNDTKKRKLETIDLVRDTTGNNGPSNAGDPITDQGYISITEPLIPETVIFEISQVSFQSPIRKKMNLIFHLIERNGEATPVLSIVNPSNQIPEVSLINLSTSIKLCIIVPILGNSTNPTKKNIVTLCFWINDETKDPIICQINLDLIKKQMIKLGKLPTNIENQFANYNESNNLSLHPIHENIIDYFKRQFKLCGINLINYLPGTHIFNNQFTLNNDNALALSNNNISNTIIMVDCHKGAKDGVLLLLNTNEFNHPYVIFGFKKPILLFEISKIKDSSYTNITRLTFSVLFTVVSNKGEERIVEFSMIDQNFFQIIDDFIKSQNINDNSFDSNLKEKDNKGGNHGNNDQNQIQVADMNGEDDDSDEEDGNYQEGDEEGDDDEDESDVAEEFDSDAGDSGDDNAEGEEEEEEESEVEDGNFNKTKEVEEID